MGYTRNYISTETHWHEDVTPQRSNWLQVEFRAFADGDKKLNIHIYDYEHSINPAGEKEDLFEGTFSELIELVLLGKRKLV